MILLERDTINLAHKTQRLLWKGGLLTMGQRSSIIEGEVLEMMNVQEVARAIEWLRAEGMSESKINDFMVYIATGIGLQTKEPNEKESD